MRRQDVKVGGHGCVAGALFVGPDKPGSCTMDAIPVVLPHVWSRVHVLELA